MGTNCEMLFIFYREIPPMVDVPQSLQLPNTTTKLKVHLTYPCEFIEGSHALVKNKFLDIVQKWFKPVPSNPDYYIYCPETPQSVLVSIDIDKVNS